MSGLKQSVLVLALLFCGAIAQNFDPITSFAAGAGRGFDIVYERVKSPLIDWGYSYGTEYNWEGERFSVPDQIDIQETPKTSFDSRFVLFKSYEEFFNNYIRSSSLAGSLSIGSTQLSGAFSRTKREIQVLLANNTRAASTVNNRVGLFQLNVFPNIMHDELEPGFRRAIDNLPNNYDSNAYGRFISLWGTHFLSSVQFGCKANFTVSFNTAFLERTNNSFISQQLSATIGSELKNLSINSNLATNESHVDEEFRREMSSTKTIIGGTEAVLEKEGFPNWVQSCRQQPGLVLDQSELTPINYLVENQTKAGFVERAIIEYCNTHSALKSKK